ncbi:hypothetical protein [Methanolobus vulcani]|uniref:Fe/B12 periplasmic-binding domain-containing protein n=1 Tax=Methanolobus vulcani TaxID=38026 RepID=A0A7Z8KR74_9EURY|nr:hypothetical protein [Methanolobus vulcani]TQD29548.1 hypothetical protein FKV42_00085 [Methanolobus vulcani]
MTVTDHYGENIKDSGKNAENNVHEFSITEILLAVGAGEQVVGLTYHCNYPEETKNITKIGRYVSEDSD